MSVARRLGLVLLALLALSSAGAEQWTVQTIAVRDLREATAISDDLVRRGFDAYTEFSMGSGRQWVRVRVGCFADRTAAAAVANLLRGWATRDAVVTERSEDAPARGCLVRDLGFVAPEAWRQLAPGVASFEVEVAGVTGLMRYQGGRWQVLQAPASDALPTSRSDERAYRQAEDVPRAFVAKEHAGGEILVCPGRLLAEADGAAIVEHDGSVFACRFDPPASEEAAP